MKRFTIYQDVVEPYIETYVLRDCRSLELTIAKGIELGMEIARYGGSVVLKMPGNIEMDISSPLEDVLNPELVLKLEEIILKGLRTFRGDFTSDKRYFTIGIVEDEHTQSSKKDKDRVSFIKSVIGFVNGLEMPGYVRTGKYSGIWIPVGLSTRDADFIDKILMTGFEVYDSKDSSE